MKRRWSLSDGLVAIALVGLGTLIFWPRPPSRKHSVQVTACLSNLKQLAMANQMYLADFDNRFPPKNWTDATQPYWKNKDLLECPLNGRGGYGYAMNAAVVGKVYVQPEMDRTVLYFETNTRARNLVMDLGGRAEAKHEGRYSIVAYCDTYARVIAKGQRP